MEVFLSWLVAGFGGLLAVAVLVAWWEHLARQARPAAPPPSKTTTRAVKVDLPLDTAHGLLLPLTDAEQRRSTLGGAMERMGRVGQAARSDNKGNSDDWTETGPMTLPPEPREASRTSRHR